MRLAIAVASASLAACGLSIVGVAGEPPADPNDAAAPLLDAASPADDSAVVADAGADATVPPARDSGSGCTTGLDSFTTFDSSKWTLIGAQASNGGVQLTQKDQSSAVSGIWTKTTLPLGSSIHVTVTFTDTVAMGGNDGEGIAVAWANMQALGGTDKGLGICAAPSTTGVASLLYTSSPQHVQVATAIGGGSCTTFGSVSSNIDGTGTIELVVTKSSVTALAGGGRQTEPASNVPTTGFVGVTASTGDTERSGFIVTSIEIESCP